MLVQEFLEQSAERFAEKVGLICGTARLTYAELEAQANRLAYALASHGFQRGERAVLCLPNSVELVAGIFGILKAGGVFVVVHPSTKPDKLEFILNNCQASALVVGANLSTQVEGFLARVRSLRWALLTDEKNPPILPPKVERFSEVLPAYPANRPAKLNIDLDLACLIYTSGSTGEPKGVMSDHSNVDFATSSIITYLQNTPDDIVINVLPLSFDYGLYQLLMVFKFGGTLVLEKGFAFPAAVLNRMVQEKVTGFPGVPTIYSLLMQTDLSKYDLSHLRYLTNTAAALPTSHIIAIQKAFPWARLYSMYGLTETKRTLYLPPEELDRRPASVGIPIPGTEAWLVDDEDHRLPPNSTGELVVRGRHVMRGYWNDPAATAARFRPAPLPNERCCYTGDLFRQDEEGFFYFVARKDDIIKCRGEKVAPREIENILYQLPGVREAAVVGVPDPILGQAIKAFVVLDGTPLEEKDILRHCREHLEDLLVPQSVVIRGELPKTTSGKIDKKGLQTKPSRFTVYKWRNYLMCGITGVINLKEPYPLSEEGLLRMLTQLNHRGPDEAGLYLDDWAGMGSARLSIIDIAGGQQPISNEDGTLWIVFNGEIFNYRELRPEVERLGHTLTTQTDTEIILHLYEEYGPGCLSLFNGQFVFAIWDTVNRRAFIARDRLGIRPLFYTLHKNQLLFGSEVKSLLAWPGFSVQMDPSALEQVFTYWSVQSPGSIFKGVQELPPAHWMTIQDGEIHIERYWQLDFTVKEPEKTEEEYLEEFDALLTDATLIRLRADVQVGAYLSGGLDSSTTTAIIRKRTNNHLETFSIAFSDPDFDESQFQQQMASHLGTTHHIVYCTHEQIGKVFPEVIWHTETPILRTAPAPLYLLSELVHQTGLKVVLTGEGADEILAGYDIFKEMTVRRFWAREPASELRPRLLQKLYPDINRLGQSGFAYLAAFFKRGLSDTSNPYYSHWLRWTNTARLLRFLTSDGEGQPRNFDAVPLPGGFNRWTPLAQAQALEINTFLSPYLLSSQGDRVGMAHSVEGRFPFLDFRVVEFCNSLPPDLKLRGLTEKWLLRRMAKPLLPPEIWKRPKRPYRAPIHRSFFHPAPLDYVAELLSDKSIREAGLFHPASVSQLVRKTGSGAALSEVEDMGLVGILSAQLVYHQFVNSFHSYASTAAWPGMLKRINHKAEVMP